MRGSCLVKKITESAKEIVYILCFIVIITDYINNLYEAVIPLKGVTVFSFLIGRSSPAAGMNYRILGWVYYFEFFVN